MMKKKRGGVLNSAFASTVLPVKSKSKLHSQRQLSPILPVEKACSVQIKKKKELFNMLDEIPKAKAIRAWNLARKSKEQESKFVPDKHPRKPVNPSMFCNPFKFKRGRRHEPKNGKQHTKKKRRVVDSP